MTVISVLHIQTPDTLDLRSESFSSLPTGSITKDEMVQVIEVNPWVQAVGCSIFRKLQEQQRVFDNKKAKHDRYEPGFIGKMLRTLGLVSRSGPDILDYNHVAGFLMKAFAA